jgi:hypothetical protein
LGKGGVNWEHAQGVDPYSLSNMGALERLDDPIDTPTRIHENQHKEEHKERGVHPREGNTIPRDMMDGCDDSFEFDDSQRGEKHQKDVMFHIGEPWSLYNCTRVHNQ